MDKIIDYGTELLENIVVGLLLAFIIKWTWNVTIPYLFSLPTLTWGKAWCLYFLSNCLIKKVSR